MRLTARQISSNLRVYVQNEQNYQIRKTPTGEV